MTCLDCGGTEHLRLICTPCEEQRISRDGDAWFTGLLTDLEERFPDRVFRKKTKTVGFGLGTLRHST